MLSFIVSNLDTTAGNLLTPLSLPVLYASATLESANITALIGDNEVNIALANISVSILFLIISHIPFNLNKNTHTFIL